jgi:outer membrane protein assembly factor BamA
VKSKSVFFFFILFILSYTIPGLSNTSKRLFTVRDSVSYFLNGNISYSLFSSLKRYVSSQKLPVTTAAENFFDSLGFFNIRFETALSKTVNIDIGKRCVVSGEVIESNPPLNITFPQIEYPVCFDAGDVKARADQIGHILAETGYPFANISIDISKNKNPVSGIADTARIFFKISPDQKYRFNEPMLKGNYKSSRKLLYNDIQFRKNDLFNINDVEETVRRLSSRQYITNVQALPPVILSRSDTHNQNDTFVTVPLIVNDRYGMGIEGALGFSTAQQEKSTVQGNIRCSFLNLFHSGEAASVTYTGSKENQKFNVSLSKPWLFNIPLEMIAQGGMEIEKDYYGYLFGHLRFLYETGSVWKAGLGIKGEETTPASDTVNAESGKFYGADFIILKNPDQYSKGVFSHELLLETGSGVARKEKNYSRSHIDFSTGVHVPYLTKYAFLLRFTSEHIISNETKLTPSELYRIGGYNSVRGYADDAFAFQTVFYGQFENMLYFNRSGSVYIFVDGGIGFKNDESLRSGDHSTMLGYGAGVRLPSKLGMMSVEWARNVQDSKSFGRIHLRFQNTFSSIIDKF